MYRRLSEQNQLLVEFIATFSSIFRNKAKVSETFEE